jgi:spectinomycin phosphotransferase
VNESCACAVCRLTVLVMLHRADGLSDELVVDWLAHGWALECSRVDYVPMGAGSQNWSVVVADGTRRFVKADRAGPSSEFFTTTHATAAALGEAGLDFVLAPIRDRDGEPRRRVSAEWEMAVFPFVDGRNSTLDPADRVSVAETIGRLHAAGVVPEVVVRWEPGWYQPELRKLLTEDLDRVWDGGPFGEQARSLLQGDREGIVRLLDLSDRHVEQMAALDDVWVMTHGEPNRGNTMIDASGRAMLIDCNAMMLAPRERDLRVLLYGHSGGRRADALRVLAAYQRTAGAVVPREFVLELFLAEWHLIEIGRYAERFAGQHEDSDDVRAQWAALAGYVPVDQNWPLLGPED